ncbi:hypothetical protein SLEP1_g57046 [Rubroshorea leprosula]|uniref:Leucine-rich repeat-containing N-terminal plant-type domain-containing protein n=1 Tax=Rubroshorea leprosula TaxID=152421 RepID=A0AAV5MLM6_9ROSI|nr:hypothetical protein SLEP1_g57046 [Rubroshorea leprosula]
MMLSLFTWLFMLLLATILFEINVVLVSGQCLSDQQWFLLQLKNRLDFNSSSSLKLVKWNQTTDCCMWEGVTCDTGGYVTDLDLSNKWIVGGIDNSSSLFNLQHLQSLNLANNHFNSDFPSSLSKLERIDLRDNALSGTFPTTLFEIPSLQSLVLSKNQFTGELHETPELASFTLQSLELDGNMLNGSLPVFVFGLQSLKVLILSSNNFSGPLNSSLILNLTNLSTLDLSFNSLSINGTNYDPASFPLIQTLKLASCKLKRFPNFLEKQFNLSILDLSANQIDGEIPDWIWTLQSLSYLNLSYNFLVNLQGPLQVQLSHLSVLDLRNNKLQGQLPAPSPHLAYVDYSSNKFSSIIQFYSSSSTFSFILLSNNNLQGSIPESICDATNLQVLDMSNNSLNGTIPQCLNEMQFLKVLDLSRNNLNGNISNKFSSNCSLQTLNLNGNHLEGEVPRSLANCTILEVLDLGNNQISDTFPCHLKNMSSLRVLVLRYNKFHGLITCPDDNSSWPPLQIVDLASNHFKGELPYRWLRTWEAMMVASDEFKVLVLEEDVHFELDHNILIPAATCSYCTDDGCGRLPRRIPGVCQDTNADLFMSTTVDIFSQGIYYRFAITTTIKGSERRLVKILSLFTSIDFSCNKFEGQIPKVLGEFRALYALNLSHNCFIGLIPSSLGNLQHLESLDLSSNNLSGEIPQQLGDLNFLAVLNLSHNQLEGRIPSGRQLQTFSEDSFKDNKGLCGMPLKKNCSVPPSKDKHSDDGTYIDWNFLSIELGFVFGLGIVILPLMFCKRWRVWYCKHINGFLRRFFP